LLSAGAEKTISKKNRIFEKILKKNGKLIELAIFFVELTSC
jgi:hypothetical protein